MSEFEHPHPELAETFTAWQEVHDPQAAARLIEAFGGLVLRIAEGYSTGLFQTSGVLDKGDLVTTGYERILTIASWFDPSRELRFSTVATPGLRGAASREFYRHAHAVYIPASVNPLVRFIRRCDARQSELGEPLLTDAQIEAERVAAEDPPIAPMPYTQPGEVPPYRDLVRLWDAGSWEVTVEEELEAQTDVYAGGDLDDNGATWERALVISSKSPAIEPDHADAVLTAVRVHALVRRAFARRREDIEDDPQEITRLADLLLQEDAIILKFGLDGQGERTSEEIAQELGINKQLAGKYPGDNGPKIDQLANDHVLRLLNRALKTLKTFVSAHRIPESSF